MINCAVFRSIIVTDGRYRRRARLLRRAAALMCVMSLCMLALRARAGDGVDVQGVWEIERPTSTLRPLHGEIPFTSLGRQRYEHNRRSKARQDYSYDLTMARCSSPGLPRLMLNPMRFRIWQRPGIVTIAFEWNRMLRQIDLRGIDTPPPLVPTMLGVSRAHWEGDTLVVQTDNLSDRTLIDGLVPHTDELQLTERIRLQSPDRLEDRFTIQDPKYFTHPWEATIVYVRRPDASFPEDVCLDRLDRGQPLLPTN
jgi:hypothetical protein